jgi:hypothetical protein
MTVGWGDILPRGYTPPPAPVGLVPAHDQSVRTGALELPVGVYRVAQRGLDAGRRGVVPTGCGSMGHAVIVGDS